MNLLVVDNDRTAREAICFLLEDEGHRVEGSPWNDHVWMKLKGRAIDAVFLNTDLGPASGLDVLSQLVRVWPALPVVMVTAEIDLKTATEAKRRGALSLLETPFGHDQVVPLLSQCRQRRDQASRARVPSSERRDLRSSVQLSRKD